MKKRNFFKIFVTVVYLALVGCYFTFAKFKKVDNCSGIPCVKLCSENDRPLEALATPEFLVNTTTGLLIVVDQPCPLMRILENATVSSVGLEIFQFSHARDDCFIFAFLCTERIYFCKRIFCAGQQKLLLRETQRDRD